MSTNKIPKIRFKGFAEEWEENKFKDIFVFSTGKNIKQQEASPKFKTPCVRYGELYHMYGEVINEVINRTNIDETELLFSKGDEILLPSAGEDPLDIGSASALTTKGVAIGRTINILRPKNSEIYSHIFLSYYINHNLRKEISSLSKGVSISNVYNSDLKTLTATTPSKTEQTKIGSFFENIDQLVNQHQTQHKKLTALKKAMLSKLFPKQGKKIPEIRFKGFNEEWELVRFDNIVSIARGLTYSPVNVRKDGVKVLRSSNILDDKFIEKSDDVFVEESSINIDYLFNYDIIVTSANGSSRLVGKHAIFNGSKLKYVHGGFMLRIRGEFPYFINASMSSEWYKKFIDIFTSGGGGSIGNLSKSDLEKQNILIPKDKKEQEKIGNYFQNLDSLIANHSQQLEKLEVLKKACLAKMFV
ncbi:restriction endonuclease subunit S [Tenacibaculum finnmarkense]|uniref:restriction endonuclease subunit S n=1 Tax=Tenacibaculum finnmarkense TaxID=2781243 RepID=UPI003BB4AA33